VAIAGDLKVENVVTPTTNLNALTKTVANHATSILQLETAVTGTGTLTKSRANFYVYTTSNQDPPPTGKIRLTASTLYMNPTTGDGIDVSRFLASIADVSIVCVQDRQTPANFQLMRVNGQSEQTSQTIEIKVEPYTASDTIVLAGGVDVIVSVFSDDDEVALVKQEVGVIKQNTIHVDARSITRNNGPGAIYLPEFDYQEPQTTIGSVLSMLNNRITDIKAPEEKNDAVTVSYLDSQGYTKKSGLLDDLEDVAKSELGDVAIEAALAGGAAFAAIGSAFLLLTAAQKSVYFDGILFRDGSRAMTGDFDLGGFAIKNTASVTANTVTAGSFVRTGGGESAFVKSDGTFDSSSYITSTDPVLVGITESLSPVLARTQNMSSTLGNTQINGGLILTTIINGVEQWTTVEENIIYGDSFIGNVAPGLQLGVNGARFQTIQPIAITAIYLQSGLYLDDTPRPFRFYAEQNGGPLYDSSNVVYSNPVYGSNGIGNEKGTLIGAYTMSKATATLTNGVYRQNITPPLELPIGKYRYGVGTPVGQKRIRFAEMQFDPRYFDLGPFAFTGSSATSLGPDMTFYPELIDINPNINEQMYGYYNGPRAGGFYIAEDVIPGGITAESFTRTGNNTSSDFVKSDGTFDSNTYLTPAAASLAYLTQADATSRLALKIDTAVANSTFATQTALTDGLALKIDTAVANSTFTKETALFVNTVDGPSITGPQTVPLSLFSSTTGFGSKTPVNFTQGKTIEITVRGTFTFTDSKQQETVTPSLYVGFPLYWSPGIINIPGGDVSGGNFGFNFEITFCSSSNYQLYFRYFFSDSTGNEKLHGTMIATANTFTADVIDVRVALVSNPSAMRLTASQQRIRIC
jgi:hypothetical protein